MEPPAIQSPNPQLTQQFLSSVLSQRGPSALPYSEDAKEAELILQHLLSLTTTFPSLDPKTASFTHNDGRSVNLLQADGTIPMSFQGVTYNIPVVIWLMESYPRHPPCVYVYSTRDMIIKHPHPHFNPSGLVSVPYLHNWIYPSSNLLDLVRSLSLLFAWDPPLYSQSRAPPPTNQNPPSSAYIPPRTFPPSPYGTASPSMGSRVHSHTDYRPVIGILSHPGDGATGRLSKAKRISHIAASYVKFVEAGGARVIPLIYNESPDNLAKKLDLVNGVLFTGGWAKTDHPYFETVKRIFKKALEKNDAGHHFPTVGINLGSDLILNIVSEDNHILEKFKASNRRSTLQFSENANIEGTVFQRFPPDLLTKLKTDCLVRHNHGDSISPAKLESNEKLSSFFEILTTSKDKYDKVFVSTARAKNYPVTIFQWHPEKNTFESDSSANAPHTEDAVRVTQSAANYFISEARKSSIRPKAQEVRDNLIYNYVPCYGGKAGEGYDQVYHFVKS